MAPLIDAELERVDRKHAQLTQLSKELVDAINLYHTLMRESDRPMGNPMFPGFMPQQPGMYGMYQTMPNMYMPGGPANYSHQMANLGAIPNPGAHQMSPVPGQPQIGPIPQQFQNGHMSFSTQIPPQQIGIGQMPLNHNMQAPNNQHTTSSNAQIPLSNLPIMSNQMQPIHGSLPSMAVVANTSAPQEFQHSHQSIASQPQIGGVPLTQTHHLPQQQLQNAVPPQPIPLSQQQQQPQPNIYPPQTHILHHQTSGASPVHLASQQQQQLINNNPHFAEKSNIPIFQQR